MTFSAASFDPSSEKGIAALNGLLASSGYVNGFTPTHEDAAVFEKFSSAPCANGYPHAARWHKHIGSFGDKERSAWPGQGGSKAGAPAAAADDDFDLFGSDAEEDDEEKERITQERLKAYAEKKAKKPGPIAKSSVLLDVKVWDDTTDLKDLEEKVRSVQMDGLVWGAAKKVPIGYGIHKLQILCTIQDDKVSVDSDLVEHIQDNFEELVQSVDIVAFNKI